MSEQQQQMGEAEQVLSAYLRASVEQIEDGLTKIKHCLVQLDDEQVWRRPHESMNSIANILLHLSGNMRQWLIAGLGDLADERQRQNEFDDRSRRSTDELLLQLEETANQASRTIHSMTSAQLLRPRRVQQWDIDGFQTIADSVCHFRGHVQEIIHMTRCLKGDDYRFHFVPESIT